MSGLAGVGAVFVGWLRCVTPGSQRSGEAMTPGTRKHAVLTEGSRSFRAAIMSSRFHVFGHQTNRRPCGEIAFAGQRVRRPRSVSPQSLRLQPSIAQVSELLMLPRHATSPVGGRPVAPPWQCARFACYDAADGIGSFALEAAVAPLEKWVRRVRHVECRPSGGYEQLDTTLRSASPRSWRILDWYGDYQ